MRTLRGNRRIVQIQSLVDQEAHHVEIGRPHGHAERAEPGRILGAQVGALREQQLEQRHRARIRGCDQERCPPEVDDFALTLAPCFRSTRALSISGIAHSSAVAPALSA